MVDEAFKSNSKRKEGKEKLKSYALIFTIITIMVLAVMHGFYSCPEFKKYNDGWYMIIPEQEIDTHSGNTIDGFSKKGPYTYKEMKKITEKCK